MTLPDVELNFFILIGDEFGILNELFTDFGDVFFLGFVHLLKLKLSFDVFYFNLSKILLHDVPEKFASQFGIHNNVFETEQKLIEILLQFVHIFCDMVQMFEWW